MQLYYHRDRDNDQLYIGLRQQETEASPVDKTVRVNDDIAVDLDKSGKLIGIDISNASTVVGVDSLTVSRETDEVIGVAEAAELCEVNKPNFIRDFANRPGFPQPMAELASGRLWYRSQILDYLGSTQDVQALEVALGPPHQTSVYEYLQLLLATDEIAFRHNALTYFEGVAKGLARIPSIERVTAEGMEEDNRLTQVAQSGDVDLYVNAAWELLQKYSKALESYISGLIPKGSSLQAEKLSKDVWVEALRRIQLGEFTRQSGISFTRWILNLANILIGAHGIDVTNLVVQMNQDPLEASVSVVRYEGVLRARRTATERLRSEYFVLEYLSGLSKEELESALPRHAPGRSGIQRLTVARRTLNRRLKEIKRELP